MAKRFDITEVKEYLQHVCEAFQYSCYVERHPLTVGHWIRIIGGQGFNNFQASMIIDPDDGTIGAIEAINEVVMNLQKRYAENKINLVLKLHNHV